VPVIPISERILEIVIVLSDLSQRTSLAWSFRLRCMSVVDIGTLPDGVYNRNTRIYFCCRNDGSADLPVLLPTAAPFYLLKFGDQCQKVCAGSLVIPE